MGHRPTLCQFHDSVLLLHGTGSGIGDGAGEPGSTGSGIGDGAGEPGLTGSATGSGAGSSGDTSSGGSADGKVAAGAPRVGGWEVRPASEMTLEKALDYMG